jgi:hypothetical protein
MWTTPNPPDCWSKKVATTEILNETRASGACVASKKEGQGWSLKKCGKVVQTNGTDWESGRALEAPLGDEEPNGQQALAFFSLFLNS